MGEYYGEKRRADHLNQARLTFEKHRGSRDYTNNIQPQLRKMAGDEDVAGEQSVTVVNDTWNNKVSEPVKVSSQETFKRLLQAYEDAFKSASTAHI
jgi:hypothetical protein